VHAGLRGDPGEVMVALRQKALGQQQALAPARGAGKAGGRSGVG
jgi:hypothetical protein